MIELTKKQSETLRHVCLGKLNKQIAFEEGTSEATIKCRVSQLMRLFKARCKTHIAIIAIAEGYVCLDYIRENLR